MKRLVSRYALFPASRYPILSRPLEPLLVVLMVALSLVLVCCGLVTLSAGANS